MSDIAIRVENLSKQYPSTPLRAGRLGGPQERYTTLRDTLTDAMYAPFRRLSSLVLRPIASLRAGSSSDGDGGRKTKDERRKTKDEYIWALKDVSLEACPEPVEGSSPAKSSASLRQAQDKPFDKLRAGIGRNGAGKSTLLKILSRITEPTEGYAETCPEHFDRLSVNSVEGWAPASTLILPLRCTQGQNDIADRAGEHLPFALLKGKL